MCNCCVLVNIVKEIMVEMFAEWERSVSALVSNCGTTALAVQQVRTWAEYVSFPQQRFHAPHVQLLDNCDFV